MRQICQMEVLQRRGMVLGNRQYQEAVANFRYARVQENLPAESFCRGELMTSVESHFQETIQTLQSAGQVSFPECS